MKKLLSIVMAVLLLAALAACGSHAQTETKETPTAAEPQKESAEIKNTAEPETTSADHSAASEEPPQTVSEDPEPAADDVTLHSDVLVAFFSATGTTKGVAEKIAAITDADLYEIVPAEPYSDADLNWNDRNSRSTKEQNDKTVRPEIGSEALDLSGYTTVYLGFPIWWGEEPRILDTFVESCSFDGITIIPFCTSSSSGIGRSGPNMEALAGSGNWLEGKRFGGSVSESELKSWIDNLK